MRRSSRSGRHGERRIERRLDQPPGLGLFENGRGKLGMQGMTRTVGHEMADDRMPHEREVADRIENLVPHEFVFEAESVVQHAGLAEHDGVVERPAKREPVLTEHFHVLEKRERPRWSDFFDEAVFGDAQRAGLMAEQRMIEADAVGDLEVIRRVQRNPLVPARDRNRTDDLQIGPRRRERLHTRFLNEVDEGGGAAVHDRHFRRVQLDQHVVDIQAHERGQQMLDRFNRDVVTRQPRGQLDACQMLNRRRHVVPAKVGAPEANAKPGRRGLQ